jgi:hypothetical protein
MDTQQEDLGFSYLSSANNVQIRRDNLTVTTLRGKAALEFVAKIVNLDLPQQQQLMARVTGNYKRGNEKAAKSKQTNKYR